MVSKRIVLLFVALFALSVPAQADAGKETAQAELQGGVRLRPSAQPDRLRGIGWAVRCGRLRHIRDYQVLPAGPQ